MRLTLFWKMTLGFGAIVAVLVVALTFILGGPPGSTIPAAPVVTTRAAADPATISMAQKLHPLLDDEERYARKYLAVGDPMYARLRRDTYRISRAYLDSLQQRMHGRDERALLTLFRSTHESLAASLDAPGGHAAFGGRLTDTMDVLHARIDQMIQVHQQARIATTTTAAERTDEPASRRYDVALGALLLGLAATAAFAYWVMRGVTAPLSQLRRGTERIARGDYRPVHVNGSDEIGRLARAFNAMSERLQHVDKYKADMMQQISHELRTPLQAMHAAYYMLAEQIAGPLNERQQHLVTSIRDNIDAMSTFSNQFLDLAKIEAGVMEYNKQQVDLLSLLTPIINTARIAAAPKEITIGLAAQSVPAVSVDPGKFTTVVSNLLNNAVKFTPRGGNITVSLGPCGTGARVAVKDSGVGIDADDLPKLFTKFFQGKSASAVDTKGTGVGLALVKAIVDGHGGKVYATSTIGVGSTFTVELPTPHTRSLPHAPHPN